MLFNSLQYLIFFPIVIIAYYILPQKVRYIWLLAASYYFYMCWNVKYVLLLLTSTVITYFSGLLIGIISENSCGKRKVILNKMVVGISFATNLGILFYFKYINFAIDFISKAFLRLNIQLNLPIVDVLLPVGISFYTFQALSYTMDIYRGDIKAEKNFFRYALFVSFFPQLVAGPIERSKNLLTQLSAGSAPSLDEVREGILLMIWGFFLKIVLADRIAIFVDTVYGNVEEYGGFYLIIATVLFAFQIYCDFAGYSTIAMGSAIILGIKLMDNFYAPYFSDSVAEFWRRWHISLTSWFRDYLYIPLGGSRKGKKRKYINTLIVFLTSGLWHGAQFSYVAWGGVNGLYLILGEALCPIRAKLGACIGINNDGTIGNKIVKTIITFLLVDFSWIFFRANRFLDAFLIIKSMLITRNPWILFDGSLYSLGLDEKNFRLVLLSICVLLFADYCKYKGYTIRKVIIQQNCWIRWICFSISITILLLFGKYGPAYNSANFIYFQF